MSIIIRLGKKVKAILRKLFPQKPVMSLVRRIERVKTKERVVAMTFDDGPCALPPNPAPENSDLGLTETILNILKEYDATATFDVVGDTSENYPDDIGIEGSATWGGIKYDHYPQFEMDSYGGAFNQPEPIKKILEAGHEISNHSYRHLIFGKKNIIYSKRVHFSGIAEVLSDLRKLDKLLEEKHGYKITLSRPPHYVDKMPDGFTSYDAYSLMKYQYMAASFDGAGWLASPNGYEAEVAEMVDPIKQKLKENPDFFCGQIIFQKDGYNMASRSPVVDGLPKQLELLKKHGYKVVTVSKLLKYSPFADLGEGDPCFKEAKWLIEHNHCVAYKDNTVRPDNIITRGEAAMMVAPRSAIIDRLLILEKNPEVKKVLKDVSIKHPYSTAIKWCVENGIMSLDRGKFYPDKPLTETDFDSIIVRIGGRHISTNGGNVTRGTMIKGVYSALKKQ